MKVLQKKGFTLVELLVVIAIIALLMAILMPTLGMARRQAQRSVCQGNLRQQHIACYMYMDDNDAAFPWKETKGSELAATMYFLWGGKNGTEAKADAPNRFLNPYVCLQGEVSKDTEEKQLHVFKCPADKGQRPGHSHERMPTVWDHVGCSYLPNFTANSNDKEMSSGGLWGKKITQVKNTHSLIMIRDFSFLAWFMTPEGSFGGEPFGYYYWHNANENGWGNVTFVDGHTEYLLATQDKPDYQNGDGWTFVMNK